MFIFSDASKRNTRSYQNIASRKPGDSAVSDIKLSAPCQNSLKQYLIFRNKPYIIPRSNQKSELYLRPFLIAEIRSVSDQFIKHTSQPNDHFRLNFMTSS